MSGSGAFPSLSKQHPRPVSPIRKGTTHWRKLNGRGNHIDTFVCCRFHLFGWPLLVLSYREVTQFRPISICHFASPVRGWPCILAQENLVWRHGAVGAGKVSCIPSFDPEALQAGPTWACLPTRATRASSSHWGYCNIQAPCASCPAARVGMAWSNGVGSSSFTKSS